MTLNTDLFIKDPLPYKEVFEYAWNLIGASMETHPFEDKYPNDVWDDGRGTLSAQPGLGLPGWLWLYYSPEGEMTCGHCAWADEDYPCRPEIHQPSVPLLISLDTAYGYRAKNGAGCEDLHAWWVTQMGQWLDEKGSDWWWEDEGWGTIHHRYDHIAEFGDAELGKPGEEAA